MMNRRTNSKIPALIALNAALLVVLGAVVLTPPASGQGAGGSTRARGSYTMVGGRIIGTPEAAIYIVDGVNQELIAAKWDRTRKALKGLGYQSLADRPVTPVNTTSDPGR